MNRSPKLVVLLALGLCLAPGCRQDMHDQPKYEPLERSDFFADQRASRPYVPGTVSRDDFRDDSLLYTGRSEGRFADAFPFQVTRGVMLRGQERYDIFCSPCHGVTGNGRGMAVQRGFPAPPAFHIERLRSAEAGYVYDVITNGFGKMGDYRSQVPVEDRWAIVAYVRALQLSQNATLDDVPAEARRGLQTRENP